MIVKTYKINSLSNFTTSVDYVTAGGRLIRKRIAFTPLGVASVGCTYTSTDIQEQIAIEKKTMFQTGEIFVCQTRGCDDSDNVEVKREEPTETACPCDVVPTEIKEYVKVKSVQAASNILVRDFGADPNDVDDADKVIAYGKKVGASFPNMNY